MAFLELLAINARNFTGSLDPSHAPCSKLFSGIMPGHGPGTCMPNLKFVALALMEILTFRALSKKCFGQRWLSPLEKLAPTPMAFLELLAFNAQNFTGSLDPSHAPCSKLFFGDHAGPWPGSMHAKFEVRSFSPYGDILFFNV